MRDVLVNRGVAESTVGVAELLTSEVVTNAILHAGSPPELAIRVSTRRIRVEVYDASLAVPVRCNPEPLVPYGRGMAVVDGLAADWGVDHLPRGKRVWFELPFAAAPLPSWAVTGNRVTWGRSLSKAAAPSGPPPG
jgi:hypothetical protein